MATTALTASVTQPSPNSKRKIEADYGNKPCTGKNEVSGDGQSHVISKFSANPFSNALNGKLSRKNAGNRMHMYVNLPTHLAVTRRNSAHPTTASSKLDSKNPTTNGSPSMVDSHINSSMEIGQQSEQQKMGNTSPTAECMSAKSDKHNNFCWSPRCPPDGAAFYEISPPPSSVSSSPVSKSLPETKLIDTNCDNSAESHMSATTTTPHNGISSASTVRNVPSSSPTQDLQCEMQTPFSPQFAHRSADTTSTHVTGSVNISNAAPSPSTSLTFSSSNASSILQRTSSNNSSTSINATQTTTLYTCTKPIQSTIVAASEISTRSKHVTRIKSTNASNFVGLTTTGDAHQQAPPNGHQSSSINVSPPKISESNPSSSGALSSPHHDLADGRTVVPWNIGTRSLASDDKVVQEAVSAAFALSSCVSTSIPQWIPPAMTTSRQRLLSCPPGNHSELERTDLKATRPTCLFTKAPQLSTEQVLEAISGSDARSYRGAHRNLSTSNVVMSPSSPCVKSPSDAEHNLFCGLNKNDVALRHKEYQPLFPVEAEWLRAQQRSKLYSATSPSTVGYVENFSDVANFRRQVSAGPTFNVPSTIGDNGWRKRSSKSGTKSRNHSSSQRSPTTKHPQLPYTQTHGGKLVSEEELLFTQTPCSPMMPTSPGMNQSFDPRFIILDPAMADWQNSHFTHNQLMKTDFQPSSMTQSVIFPHSAGWVASNHVPSNEKAMLSASTRQRRSKGSSISRTQSHRSVNPSMHELEPTDPSIFDLYQRSFSQTVPATQMMNGDDAWPPIMAHWHHRQRTPFVSNNNLSEVKHQSESRRVRRSKTGRSSHDISHFEGMRLTQAPQHHHNSTSAILDRLEDHTWFHPHVSRAEAERLLHPMREGSFLVRQSDSKQSGYSLSIRRESDVLHMKITQDMETGHFVLGEYSQPYPSIVAMIHRYRRSLLPVRGTTPILLRYAVENRCHTDSVRRA